MKARPIYRVSVTFGIGTKKGRNTYYTYHKVQNIVMIEQDDRFKKRVLREHMGRGSAVQKKVHNFDLSKIKIVSIDSKHIMSYESLPNKNQ